MVDAGLPIAQCLQILSEQSESKVLRDVTARIANDVQGGATLAESFGKYPKTFDNLFVPNTSPLEAIFPLVQRDLERQNALSAAILPSTGRDPSHYQNFAITEDQLIFYFAPGEMLPAFAGPCEAQVPRNALPPLAV